MPGAALLIVGGEMLDPARADANGPLARQALAELGIPLRLLARVEDRVETLSESIGAALRSCDVVLTSGGIGPTGDDLTREAAAACLGRGVREDADWVEVIRGRLAERGRELTELGRRQALLVEGAERLENSAGLACGSYLDLDGRVLGLLPGVPREFRAMLAEEILPRLARKFDRRPETRTLRVTLSGLPEVRAEEALRPWYAREGVGVSILPSLGVLRVTFTFTSPPAEDLPALESEAKACLEEDLGRHIVSFDGKEPEERIGDLLLARGWTLAAAESCTGGRVSSKVVSVAGASRYFMGSICAYDNGAKEDLLGVPRSLLEARGAVCEEVALAMVRGARARFGASCAVATTGVAGPAGGSPEKPVGTVWLAVGTPVGERTHLMQFPAERAIVMELAANTALYLLWRALEESGGPP